MLGRVQLFAVSVAVAVILLAAWHGMVGAGEQDAGAMKSTGPLSQLDKGMWWITETAAFVDISLFNSGPRKWAEKRHKHKWSVSGEDKIGDQPCWVIEIRPVALPREIKNAHGESPLYTVYLSKTSGHVCKFVSTVRSGGYLVEGGNVRRKETTYKRKQPVVVTWIPSYVPLDFGILPEKWPEHEYPPEKGVRTFPDERGGSKITQVLFPFQRDGNPNLLVTLKNEDGQIRTQLWDTQCPWWREWHCVQEDGKVRYKRYSRTIDWKGKKEGKETNGTTSKAGDHP